MCIVYKTEGRTLMPAGPAGAQVGDPGCGVWDAHWWECRSGHKHEGQASGLSKKPAPGFQVKAFDSSMHATEAQLPLWGRIKFARLCCGLSAASAVDAPGSSSHQELSC